MMKAIKNLNKDKKVTHSSNPFDNQENTPTNEVQQNVGMFV